ncbi:MAG TPA: hypothetical protein VL147_10880 [Devosia sp.]|nr:hypothetical protein [Devosia sp.]
MVGALARKIPYLLVRDGRHFARRTVPPELQSYVGTIELREPLGPDRKIALKKLHLALQVLARMYDRDDGIEAHEIAHPPHLDPVVEEVIDEPFVEPLSLRELLEQHLRRLEANGGGIRPQGLDPRLRGSPAVPEGLTRS